MPADYVRRTYGVNYKRGDRVTVDGRPGTVVSSPGQYLGVRFDGEWHTSRAHPTWRVEAIPAPEPCSFCLTREPVGVTDDLYPICDECAIPEPGDSSTGGTS